VGSECAEHGTLDGLPANNFTSKVSSGANHDRSARTHRSKLVGSNPSLEEILSASCNSSVTVKQRSV